MEGRLVVAENDSCPRKDYWNCYCDGGDSTFWKESHQMVVTSLVC